MAPLRRTYRAMHYWIEIFEPVVSRQVAYHNELMMVWFCNPSKHASMILWMVLIVLCFLGARTLNGVMFVRRALTQTSCLRKGFVWASFLPACLMVGHALVVGITSTVPLRNQEHMSNLLLYIMACCGYMRLNLVCGSHVYISPAFCWCLKSAD